MAKRCTSARRRAAAEDTLSSESVTLQRAARCRRSESSEVIVVRSAYSPIGHSKRGYAASLSANRDHAKDRHRAEAGSATFDQSRSPHSGAAHSAIGTSSPPRSTVATTAVITTTAEDAIQCRICLEQVQVHDVPSVCLDEHDDAEDGTDTMENEWAVDPCDCSGSAAHVHLHCLQRCELMHNPQSSLCDSS